MVVANKGLLGSVTSFSLNDDCSKWTECLEHYISVTEIEEGKKTSLLICSRDGRQYIVERFVFPG